MWVKNVTDFWRFSYPNISCLRINITSIFMSFSSNEFTHLWEKSKTDVSVGFRRPYLCPSKGHQHGVSIQSFINLSKTFFQISRLWNITETWLLARLFLLIFFHFPDSGLSVLNGLHFYFWWRGSENKAYHKQHDRFAWPMHYIHTYIHTYIQG